MKDPSSSGRSFAVVTGASSGFGSSWPNNSRDAIAINAGLSGNFAKDTELKAELNLIALNVTSSVHLAKRVVHDMVDRKHGRILFASSVAGRMPAPLEAVYGASRAFLLSFSEALRSELQDFGVTVAALMPNFFSAKDDPADVARYGFEALMAGDNRVLAGRGISRRTFSDRAGR